MEEILEKLREEVGDPTADFETAFSLGASLSKNYVWNLKFRKTKPDGSFTKKVYECPIMMKYNPITGEKL